MAAGSGRYRLEGVPCVPSFAQHTHTDPTECCHGTWKSRPVPVVLPACCPLGLSPEDRGPHLRRGAVPGELELQLAHLHTGFPDG